MPTLLTHKQLLPTVLESFVQLEFCSGQEALGTGGTLQGRGSKARVRTGGPTRQKPHCLPILDTATTASCLLIPSPRCGLALTAWGLGAPCSLIMWLCKSFFCMNCWEQEEH